MRPHMKDAELRATKALPNGALTTTTDPIQLHAAGVIQDFVAPTEVLLVGPALTTAELPDGQTVTYTIESSDTADFASSKTISGGVVQTGAAGAGAAIVAVRIHPTTDVQAYVRGKAVKTGASNASTQAMTLELTF